MSQTPEDEKTDQSSGESKPSESPTPSSSQSTSSQEEQSRPAQEQKAVSPPPATPKPTPVVRTAAQPSTPTVAKPVPPRPATTTPISGKPSIPPKPKEETKQDISRRNFLRGIAVVGGLIALGEFGLLGPFLTGSVSLGGAQKQQIFDAISGGGSIPLTTSNPGPNDWRVFVYPKTNDPNVDSDTFKQCVLIHLPKGFVAPSDSAYRDPTTGDYYVAFSRVCVHLWCLWSYFPNDKRMECPCHGSQYVPGGTPGSNGSSNPGLAVAGPASLQTAPNNQLPIIKLTTDSKGNFFATGIVGQIGCGQKC